MKVAIITVSGDIHASHISDYILERGGEVYLVFTDMLSKSHFFGFFADSQNHAYELLDIHGRKFDLDDMNSVWWRRISSEQRFTSFSENSHKIMVERDWEAFLYSLSDLDTCYNNWVSNPHCTRIASSKIRQLKKAAKVGLQIPDTIISNKLEDLQGFISSHDGCIIKSISTIFGVPSQTCEVKISELTEESVQIAPVLIQEKIEGDTHLRVNVFGDQIYCFEIASEHLDWRPGNESARFTHEYDDQLSICVEYLKSFGLQMGIFDFKVNPQGELIFFECNPQGQFIFLEPLSGYPIGEEFAEFLIKRCC